jgi:hypothetical protein
LKNEGDANQEDPHEQDGSVQSADDPYEFEYETAAQQGRTESDALIDYEEGYNFGGAKLPEEEYESKDCKKPSLPEDPPLKNPNIWRVSFFLSYYWLLSLIFATERFNAPMSNYARWSFDF